MFWLIDIIQAAIGNFGIAILTVTVLVKLVFFPLAYKSYVSMSKMKKLAPEMEKIKTRFPDDRAKQQQAMMEMYKKEQVSPLSGCWPILIQIPVFFALYKVLFVSIEMRHAPFFGWIKDLYEALYDESVSHKKVEADFQYQDGQTTTVEAEMSFYTMEG